MDRISFRARQTGRSPRQKNYAERVHLHPGMALAVLVAGFLTPLAGLGQVPAFFPEFQGGVVLDRYSFSDEEAVGIRNLSLLTVPLAGAVPLGTRITAEVRTAFAAGSMERANGETVEVSGLTDTELRLGFRIPGEFSFHLQGIAVLPTGNSTHSPEEARVAGAMAADLLPFRISNWGSGGGFGGHTSVAHSFGDTGIGASASYLVGRDFEPLEGQSFSYRPGDQLRLRGALDHNLSQDRKVTLTLTLERYSEDALEGANLYQAGNRVQAVGAYSFRAWDRGSALLYGGIFHRGGGDALLESAPSIPPQNLLLAGGGIRLPSALGVLVPSVDTRLFRTDDGVGQGWLTGVGLGLEVPIGQQTLIPSIRGRIGNLVIRDGQESGIAGIELSVTTRVGG